MSEEASQNADLQGGRWKCEKGFVRRLVHRMALSQNMSSRCYLSTASAPLTADEVLQAALRGCLGLWIWRVELPLAESESTHVGPR